MWWTMPPPPPRASVLGDLIEEDPVGVKWHTPDETRYLLSLMNDLHLEKVVSARNSGRRMVGTIYKRMRPDGIKLDASRSLRTVIRDVVGQAVVRQRESGGTIYAGAVLQHLVGAKLDCALGTGNLEHNSFSTADAHVGKAGDFVVGDVAIHVTTSPGEAVIERCRDNLNDGFRPMLVTMERGLVVAQELARNAEIEDRIDVFEIEQFVALNLYEIGHFKGEGRRTALDGLVKRHNEIVEMCETDPSLKIEIRK